MSDNKKEEILGELTTAYWMEMDTGWRWKR
jgi:hypothetical protein